VDYCWRAANNNRLHPKLLLLSYYKGWSLLVTSHLKYLLITELRFDVILYSKLGNENSDAVHTNVHAGSIWPVGRRFPPLSERVK